MRLRKNELCVIDFLWMAIEIDLNRPALACELLNEHHVRAVVAERACAMYGYAEYVGRTINRGLARRYDCHFGPSVSQGPTCRRDRKKHFFSNWLPEKIFFKSRDNSLEKAGPVG